MTPKESPATADEITNLPGASTDSFIYAPESQPDPALETVDLDTPVVRGNQIIQTVTLRKPKAGALRGLSIVALSQLDVNALQKLLPRISTPTLTEADVANMEPEDLVALGVKVAGFLLQKEDRLAFQ